MKLDFFISRPANKFYYLQNLVSWHFASRTKHPKEWEKITGPLNNEEKKIIKKFATTLKEKGYQYDKQGKSVFPGVPFFTSKEEGEAFKKAKDFLDKKQLEIFKQTFDIFEPKFSQIWKHYDKHILSSLKKIKNETEKESFKKLINRASVICNEDTTSEIKVSVIISPSRKGDTAAGTAIIGYKTVTLELPKTISTNWVKLYSIGVLVHEIIHIMLEKDGVLSKEIKKAIKKNGMPEIIREKPTSVWINESIVESLAPAGFLMQNYYPNEIADCLTLNADRAYSEKTVDNLKDRLLWEIYPMAAHYGRAKKSIDKKFVENTAKILKEIIKKEA